MKYQLITFVICSILLAAGCQENQIMEPVQEKSLIKTDDPLNHTGTIMLSGLLQDPHPIGNSYYRINGNIQYNHTLQVLDPIPPNPQYFVQLKLHISSDFTYECTTCSPSSSEELVGFIYDISEEDFLIVDNNEIFEKTYAIEGGGNMVLKCRFVVTIDSISLNGMWLELNDADQT